MNKLRVGRLEIDRIKAAIKEDVRTLWRFLRCKAFYRTSFTAPNNVTWVLARENDVARTISCFVGDGDCQFSLMERWKGDRSEQIFTEPSLRYVLTVEDSIDALVSGVCQRFPEVAEQIAPFFAAADRALEKSK